MTRFPFFSSFLTSVHLGAQECGNFLVLRFLFMHSSSVTSSFAVICSPILPAAREARVKLPSGRCWVPMRQSLEEAVCQNDLRLSFPFWGPVLLALLVDSQAAWGRARDSLGQESADECLQGAGERAPLKLSRFRDKPHCPGKQRAPCRPLLNAELAPGRQGTPRCI